MYSFPTNVSNMCGISLHVIINLIIFAQMLCFYYNIVGQKEDFFLVYKQKYYQHHYEL